MNREVRLINLKDHRIISDKCLVAESYLSRLRGWIGKTHASEGEGILFPKCMSIHMWFMSIPIDVVFLRAERVEKDGVQTERKVVVAAHSSVRPWKPLPLTESRANETLELPEGSVKRLGISEGDVICIA